RVSALQTSGHAGGAQESIEIGRCRGQMLRRRGRFRRVRTNHGAKVSSGGWTLESGRTLKEAAGGFIKAYGKLKSSQRRESRGKVIDRVLAFPRPRTVAAAALCLQMKIDIILLAGLQTQQQPLTVLGFKVAGISVEAVLGVDQFSMVLEQPLHA